MWVVVVTLFRLGVRDLQIKIGCLAEPLLVEDCLLEVVHADVQTVKRDRVIL